MLDHGERRIFTYGTARPDSIFEIRSITKTFTGLILAQMVVQKQVKLNEPVRALLQRASPGSRARPISTGRATSLAFGYAGRFDCSAAQFTWLMFL